jgi:hypothetical protein
MRNLLLLILATHAFAAGAAPRIKQKTNNGIWRVENTWDLNRVPAHTDTVVIPSGNVVLIDDHQNLGTSKLIVMVYGTLQFTGVGKLTLDNNSAIFVQSGGIVDGDGSAAQKLRIGSQQLSGNDLQVAATSSALLLTATSSGYDPVPPSSSFGTYAILPVTFTNFIAVAASNGVEIKWATVNEVNNRHFEVEHSMDAVQWRKLATVAATTTSTEGHYSYKDASVPKGTIYYRIKQVDQNGLAIYTPYRSLTIGEKTTVKIWSASQKLAIDFSAPVEGTVKVRLIAMSGKVVHEEVLSQGGARMTIDKKDQKGYYIVIVTNAKGMNVAQKVAL